MQLTTSSTSATMLSSSRLEEPTLRSPSMTNCVMAVKIEPIRVVTAHSERGAWKLTIVAAYKCKIISNVACSYQLHMLWHLHIPAELSCMTVRWLHTRGTGSLKSTHWKHWKKASYCPRKWLTFVPLLNQEQREGSSRSSWLWRRPSMLWFQEPWLYCSCTILRISQTCNQNCRNLLQYWDYGLHVL